MTKTALLVGINKYPAPADSLQAPVKEARNWERILLAECGFDRVKCLVDEDATREDFLRELRTLLTSAADGDDILIGFGGHGAKARGWESDTVTNDEVEQAFIVYAGEEETGNFQHAAVTPSDFARILKEKRPPSGVRIAVSLDCCNAARFGGKEKHDAPKPVMPRVLFIENAVPGLRDTEPRTFGAIAAMVADRTIADPIILAAAGPEELATEVGLENDKRLLFSQELQREVEDAFSLKTTLSIKDAIDAITPLSEVQSPVIVGNEDLKNEQFGGGFATQVGIPEPAASELAVSTLSAADTLTIRMFGLVTLIDLPPNKLPYRNRIVAPYDNWAQKEKDMHHAFVEVADRDFKLPPKGLPTNEYVRGGIKYSRWQLSQHRVIFSNVAETGMPVQRSSTFNQHVPSLPVVSYPALAAKPRPQAYEYDLPTANFFTAFFDLQCGDATIDLRDLEAHRTLFRTRYTKRTTWGPEYTAISALVTLPLASNYVVLSIFNSAGKIETVIFVNSGATIQIGNARELDINGPGSGEGPREHFLIYYQLAPEEPPDAGLPETVQVPINACTVTTWP